MKGGGIAVVVILSPWPIANSVVVSSPLCNYQRSHCSSARPFALQLSFFFKPIWLGWLLWVLPCRIGVRELLNSNMIAEPVQCQNIYYSDSSSRDYNNISKTLRALRAHHTTVHHGHWQRSMDHMVMGSESKLESKWSKRSSRSSKRKVVCQVCCKALVESVIGAKHSHQHITSVLSESDFQANLAISSESTRSDSSTWSPLRLSRSQTSCSTKSQVANRSVVSSQYGSVSSIEHHLGQVWSQWSQTQHQTLHSALDITDSDRRDAQRSAQHSHIPLAHLSILKNHGQHSLILQQSLQLHRRRLHFRLSFQNFRSLWRMSMERSRF